MNTNKLPPPLHTPPTPQSRFRRQSPHSRHTDSLSLNVSKGKKANKRYVGLDILRYLLAFLIFLFHSNIHIGCSYSIFNPFVEMGAIAMTGFFMLSGYSLYVTYRKKDLYKLNEIRIFYIKRFIGVFPIYYVTALAYVILLGKETLIENILLAPISFLGLQSIYTGTFSISHVGGTWFISCITLCYLVYPYLQILVNQMENKGKITLIVICVFILFWSPFLRHIFSLSTYYDNPLIRLMEFMVGILIANLNLADNVKWVKLFQTKMSLCAGCVILFSGVSLLRYFTRNGDYMLYDWIALPSFIMIIMSSGKLQFVKLSNNKVISYLSALSYDFFLAQFFVWPICRKIFILTGFTDNIFKIVISLIICFIISILMHELIEKPVKRYLNSQMLKPKLVTI